MSSRFAAALALSLVLSPAAGAIPPPPAVTVMLIAPPALREDSAHLLRTIGGGGAWFETIPSPVPDEAFAQCAATADAEPCVRDVLRTRAHDRPPLVAVIASTGSGFHIFWRCIGVGETATNPHRQFVSFDTLAWRSAGGPSHADRQAAAGCVLAAASESGW